MDTVTSADGTAIAYDRAGTGPAIIFVVGAFNERSTCAPLAEVRGSPSSRTTGGGAGTAATPRRMPWTGRSTTWTP